MQDLATWGTFFFGAALALVLGGLGFLLMSPYHVLGSILISAAPIASIIGWKWGYFGRLRIQNPCVLRSDSAADALTSPAPLWLTAAIAIVLILGIVLGAGTYIEQSQVWPLTNEQVSQRELHDISFNLYDLLRGRNILEHRVFTRCIIYGPAVIEILGNDTFFYRPHWLVPPEIPQNKQADSVFLALPVGTFISGAIFVRHCEFRDCKFQSIQILGTEEQREKFRKSIATAEVNHGNDIP